MSNEKLKLKEVTIVYYCDNSIVLKHEVLLLPQAASGRVIIPRSFVAGKSILMVCEGSINILNKLGERILPSDDFMETDNS